MDNIYFDVGNLLVKNLLLNDLNPDTVSYIYIVAMYASFFIGILLMASPFVLSFLYRKEIKNENAFVLFSSGVIMLFVVSAFHVCRKNHDMNQTLIQSKEAIHMLAVKHNVDDKVAFEITQDILLCNPSAFKYTFNPSSSVAATTSATIQCENKNYYGKKIDYYNAKQNLNIIQSIQNPELFIMQN